MNNLRRILAENRSNFNLWNEDFIGDFVYFDRLTIVENYGLKIKNDKNEYFRSFKQVFLYGENTGFIHFCDLNNEYQYCSYADHDKNLPLEDQNIIVFEYADRIKDLLIKLCSIADFNNAGLNKPVQIKKEIKPIFSEIDLKHQCYEDQQKLSTMETINISEKIYEIADILNQYTEDLTLLEGIMLKNDICQALYKSLNKIESERNNK